MNIEEMDFSVRTYNALKRIGIDTAEDCIARMSEIEKMTRIAHLDVKNKLKELGLMPETKVIVSEEYTRAVTLDKRIKANTHAMEDCFWEVCKGLKEMRDGKLYKELGYQNFEDYSQNEIGISREQARKYIKISETYSDENANPGWHLGATKLFLLTKLDEPLREDFIQNNDVSEMSKRELEEKIKEINDLKEHNKQLAEKIKAAESIKDMAINENQALSGVLSTVKADKNRLFEQNEQLMAKIKELEARPLDVTVATPDNSEEIEKLKEEYEDRLCEKHGQLMAEMQRSKENSKIAHEALKEVEELKKKLEQKPKEVEVPDFEEVFSIYLNTFTDAGRKLLSFVKQHDEYKESAGLWARDIAKDFEI